MPYQKSHRQSADLEGKASNRMIKRALIGLLGITLAAGVLTLPRIAGAVEPLPGESGLPAGAPGSRLELRLLSGTHSIVAGDHALVGVGLSRHVRPETVRISLNGRDVTSAFSEGSQLAPRFEGLVGLVSGMRPGANELRAGASTSPAPDGSRTPASRDLEDRLVLNDYPTTGPIFSGPQLHPWFCTTALFGLGEPTDDACDAPTQVQYQYKSTGGSFKALTDLDQLPPDVASTTTSDGRTVRYIVRLETGTLDRGIYQIGILDDPFEPGSPGTRGWNRRLVYSFGGNCNPGPIQGMPSALRGATALDLGGAQGDQIALAKGYAVATSTLNAYATACNEVLSAEAALMVKQRFVETYGVPDWTVGFGGSGGSLQLLQIAQDYPGLLDGIIANRTLPDAPTLVPLVLDCSVLAHYFSASQVPWTADQQAAVEGMFPGTCNQTFSNLTGIGLPSVCPPAVPASAIYDAASNPDGVRCDVFDSMVNVYGRNPVTGFANRFWGNQGVQYGLQALLDGRISGEQFLDLNQRVGGLDVDGGFIAHRTPIDAPAVRTAYSTGRISNGRGGLLDVPILDLRPWDDANPADPHISRMSLILRDRLDRAAGGRAGNYVYWVTPPQNSAATVQPFLDVEKLAVDTMSRWLDAIAADASTLTARQKVATHRPADAADACFTSDGARHEGSVTLGGSNFCSTTFPATSFPRLVAGAPATDDILQCQQEAVSAEGYDGKLTTDQLERLRQIFPEGVCDYGKPSQNAGRFLGTWLSFGVG
jgi:Tannase-like family of unknown function (DUF6351)